MMAMTVNWPLARVGTARKLLDVRRCMATMLICVGVALATVARGDPPTTDDPAMAVVLERAWRRFDAALSQARWRRDDPAVVAVAEGISREMTAYVEAGGRPPLALRALFVELSASGVNTLFGSDMHVSLVSAQVRARGDVDALSHLIALRSPAVHVHAAAELAPWRAAAVLSLLASPEHFDTPHGAEACALALTLPTTQRRVLAMRAWQSSSAYRVADCAVLIADHPALGADLARRTLDELQRSHDGDHTTPWSLAAMAVSITRGTPTVAASLRGVVEARGRSLPWHIASPVMARVSPWLLGSHPHTRWLLGVLERFVGDGDDGMLGLRITHADPARVGRLIERIEHPEQMQGISDALVREVGLSAAPGAMTHRAIQTLTRYRARMGSIATAATPVWVDQWIDALTATERCASPACLVALMRNAPEETAARAVVRLGAQGLAALPHEAVRVLLDRIALELGVRRGAHDTGYVPPLSLATMVTLRGCPSSLRGLSMLEAAARPHGVGVVEPWRLRLLRACGDTRPTGP
jgi:hypothetical protein